MAFNSSILASSASHTDEYLPSCYVNVITRKQEFANVEKYKERRKHYVVHVILVRNHSAIYQQHELWFCLLFLFPPFSFDLYLVIGSSASLLLILLAHRNYPFQSFQSFQ